MRNRMQRRQFWKRFLPIILFMVTLAGCRIWSLAPESQPLTAVSSLPLPQLPDWIEEISPTGETTSSSQVRIRFKYPLIPVEQLDSPRQRQLLNQFEMTPNLPGHFRFLTPRMVGFQADKALPLSTRVQVRLKQGLEDLNDHRLEQDLAWTFRTESIQFSDLPGTETRSGSVENPVGLMPQLSFRSNVQLDVRSLQEHVKLALEGGNQTIPVKVALSKNEFDPEDLSPQAQFNPAYHNWHYTISPTESLAKSSIYTLEITPGVRPIQGNLESQFVVSTQIHTYQPLQFQGVESYGLPNAGGTYGRFENGSPQLKFNHGISAESAINHITISPQPEDVPRLIQAYEGSDIITINPWALSPQTEYTITVDQGLEDQFGQTLEKSMTVDYQTGDLAADIQVPNGLNIFPANNPLQLNISTVNLPRNRYKAAYRRVRPTDLVYTDTAYPRKERKNLLPSQNSWSAYRVEDLENEVVTNSVNLSRRLGKETGLLAYGVQAKTNSYIQEGQKRSNVPEFYGLVQLTNLGVFAQWFPESGLIRVHHLEDGSAAAEATIEIYQSKLDAESFPTPKACATGITNGSGILQLNAEELQQCMNGERFSEPPELLVIAKEDSDWAFTRTYAYSGAYGYGIYPEWNNETPQSRGLIFSDRQLYQPGEKIALTGAAYYLENGELKQDSQVDYQVTLIQPDGEEQDLGTYATNEFGTFSIESALDTDTVLGDYTLKATAETGVEINGNFRVAEFKPPNFKVDINVDKNIALAGETLTANTESDYLFGSPVVGGKVQYYVTRTPTTFIPEGWPEYSFGRQWFWPEEQPSISSDVWQKNQVLNDEGKDNQTVKIAKDLPYPTEYRIDVEVGDVSNLAVSNSKTITALPSNRLIGLKSPFVAEANQAFPIEVIVTNPEGKVLDNVAVRLELQKMNYSSVTRVVEGGRTAKNQIEYETVAETTTKSEKTAKTVNLTPPDSGSYRIRANFGNSPDTTTATDIQIWVTGNSAVSWRSLDENRLEIKLDKDKYQPGETATALIQSTFEAGELYFAVIRDKPLYEMQTTVTGGAPQIQFTVTPEMLPNAAVEAVLVRQGMPLSEVEPGSIDQLTKIGFAAFETDLENQSLQVDVTPTQTELKPGAQQTLELELKDSENRPIRGQLTVMVVNDAILQLNGYRPPNLLETVYAYQPISTRFSDNRPDVQVAASASFAAEKGWGYGGGTSASIASPRLRKDFQPLAYYNSSVVTDNQGKATIKFNLTDDFTTWRVMVVATDGNLHFGSTESTFITTQTLLSNPILPQFSRPGDKILGGVAVTNTTPKTGTVNITGELDSGIKFSAANQTRQTIKSRLQPGTEAYQFPMVVQEAGTTQVKFTTEFNNQSDAFEVPLEVKPYTVTESVIETGITTEKIVIPLNVSRNMMRETGGLDISISSTLIPQITAPAKAIFRQTETSFLEPNINQLVIAANLKQLGEKYNQAFTELNLNQKISEAIEKITLLQAEDGGISAYPGQTISDRFLSVYTAEALFKADVAGIEVPAALINSLQTYLQQILANPGKDNFCTSLVCKNRLRLNILMALANWEEPRNEFISDIYGLRKEFDLVTQIKLARYLTNFPQWQSELETLLTELEEVIYQTGRTATVNLPPEDQWMSSATVAQAEALQLMIAQNRQPELIDKLLQSLLDSRRNGMWNNGYDNAAALTALVAYAETESIPENLAVEVQLGTQQLGSFQLNGTDNTSWNLTLLLKELPPGKNNLVITPFSDEKLNYAIAFNYRLAGNQPGRFNGLRVDRNVRLANDNQVLENMGLSTQETPFKVLPGQVFDIGLELIVDRRVNHVMIVDPLPAGMEVVDTSFEISNQAVQAQADSWQIDYQTIYKDRIFAYADTLEPGVYQLHYLVRSVTAGEFLWPGTKAHLQYAPEEFGRATSSILVISEP
ncbi:MAG: Ig-like domain-containing protein [Microcoleaceae cyanobacterium]